ncbi:phosphatidylinositol-glycan biosynthesis class X protein [Leptidea sinapis]|uniref:phosphatidylinositol-glycan biosynthesis class X protein n=1 Tax=Leptidea sinapis TaxID=189913 RepID=UPI00213FE7D5|nr:phosphatidylinositol-glycan biosynthesis class X protein [Leptidea sinapis]
MRLFTSIDGVLWLALLFVIFAQTNCNRICDFKVRLTQTLHNEGFHRNLTYYIEYTSQDKINPYNGCSVGLEVVLPPGVYASPDQLASIKSKSIAVFKTNVNTESAAHEADIVIVHLLGTVYEGVAELSLPVHARYHSAVDEGTAATVVILPPRAYLNCGVNSLERCEEPPRETPAVNHFCAHVPQQRCPWRETPLDMSSGPLRWSVPVGDSGHLPLVASVSAAVAALGSFYLLYVIHCVTIRLRTARADKKK